jgi:thioredoxin reductase (NADPH)
VESAQVDCLVIGGGPAGLTAAIYLARFHLSVTVADAGGSRAATIPLTRNHAGYPGGIAGRDLVARMTEQAVENGARIQRTTITRLERHEGGFTAYADDETAIRSRMVLLATGVVNRRPLIAGSDHDAALARGLLRYCPICDGYEVTDRKVGVIGTGDHGVREAVFLRSFTADLTLIAPDGPHDLTDDDRREAKAAGIVLVDGPVTGLAIAGDMLRVITTCGGRQFDSVYPAMGSDIRSELARQVGASVSGQGCMTVDRHQRTDVPGLYAAGDVVLGLDQISHAMGEGGVAATAMRNDLAARLPLRR